MTAVVIASFVLAGPADPFADWAGTWAGTLKLNPDDDKTVPMSLTVTAGDGKYGWKIEYDAGTAKRVVKDYELMPVPGKQGFFEMDEKNGVKLLGRKTGNTLRFVYQVQTQLYDVRYNKSPAGLNFDLNVSDTAKAVESKVRGQELKVLSFPPAAAQTANLVKK